MQELDDAALLQRIAQQRDRGAYAELYSRYEKRAYHLALHLTRNHELAQDAVQNAMLDLWLCASAYRPGNPAGWIVSIVVNKSLMLAKRSKRESQRMREQEGPETSPSPVDLSEHEERLGALRRILEQLPELDRQALALCYVGGLSQQEAGEALSLSRMALARRLEKACEQVRLRLGQAGFAAALPMVSAEGLREALGSGHAVPAALREKVLVQVAQPVGKAVRALSRRAAAKAPAGKALWLTGLLALTLGGAPLWWWAASTPPISPPPAQAAQPPKAPSAAPEEAPFYFKWSFEQGPVKELAFNGLWEWKRKDEKSPGYMYAPPQQKTNVFLPFSLPSRPFVVTVKFTQSSPNFKWEIWTNWAGEQPLPFKSWGRKDLWARFKGPSSPFVFRMYFLGRYRVSEFDTWSGTGLANFVAEHSEAYPSKVVGVSLENVDTHEIELKSLRPEEIPERLKDPQRLIQQMQQP